MIMPQLSLQFFLMFFGTCDKNGTNFRIAELNVRKSS